MHAWRREQRAKKQTETALAKESPIWITGLDHNKAHASCLHSRLHTPPPKSHTTEMPHHSTCWGWASCSSSSSPTSLSASSLPDTGAGDVVYSSTRSALLPRLASADDAVAAGGSVGGALDGSRMALGLEPMLLGDTSAARVADTPETRCTGLKSPRTPPDGRPLGTSSPLGEGSGHNTQPIQKKSRPGISHESERRRARRDK